MATALLWDREHKMRTHCKTRRLDRTLDDERKKVLWIWRVYNGGQKSLGRLLKTLLPHPSLFKYSDVV